MDGGGERHSRPDTRGRSRHGRRGRKKKLGVFELLGIAVGNIGIPYNDFCGLTPEEFSHIYRAYSERQEAQYKDDWERMRMLACICIQPYAKKGLTPHSLLPLPWDGRRMPGGAQRKTEIPSKRESVKRLKEVLEKTKEG